MNKRDPISLPVFLFLFGFIFVAMPFLSSCGKSGSVGPASNIRYEIINLSPDLGSVDFYINYRKVNTYSYFYPGSSGYFVIPKTDTPFQIRSGATLVTGTTVSTVNYFSFVPGLNANTKYTLFITGLSKSDSLQHILTVDDTAKAPAIGRGKIRFINASPRSTGLDVIANGSSAFTSQKYLVLSDYKEFPAGNYNFQLFQAGTTIPLLGTLQNITIQDGRLYTLYTYGLTNHADSLAFGARIINNGVNRSVIQ